MLSLGHCDAIDKGEFLEKTINGPDIPHIVEPLS